MLQNFFLGVMKIQKFKNVKGLFNFKTINQNKVRKKRTRKN